MASQTLRDRDSTSLENSISELVLGDLTEITLVAQASDREHVPSCRQPLTSTDASYTGKEAAAAAVGVAVGRLPGQAGRFLLFPASWPGVGIGRRRFARCWTPEPGAASTALEAGRGSPDELAPGRRRRRRQGQGMCSRELLHYFSPLGLAWGRPLPPEICLRSDSSSPDVHLQVSLLPRGGHCEKPDAHLQVSFLLGGGRDEVEGKGQPAVAAA
ncbi:uncharacterized protein [Vicugna pacos]|uniref:Uncharacterized protein n=1 Tax=Vicugna pacos TaxID=30538 RepID=A0ABM5CX90_VICPA